MAAIAAITFAALLFAGGNALWAITANVNVQSPKTADHTAAIQANDLRPQDCIDQSITVARVVTGDGVVTGDDDGDLLLAKSTTTDVVGGAGNDCIIGGGSATVDGGGGNDVCIGSQTVVFANCETEVRQ